LLGPEISGRRGGDACHRHPLGQNRLGDFAVPDTAGGHDRHSGVRSDVTRKLEKAGFPLISIRSNADPSAFLHGGHF